MENLNSSVPVPLAANAPHRGSAHNVLADRLAAALVQREPGWRLPRRSSLARRFGASIAEIDLAIGELVRRSLIRRLPDGQLYRASPAAYVPEAVAQSLIRNDLDGFRDTLSWIPANRPGAEPARAAAVDLEMAPAQPSVARTSGWRRARPRSR